MRGWVPSVVVVGCLLAFGASESVAQDGAGGVAPPPVLSTPPAEPPVSDAPDATPLEPGAEEDSATKDGAAKDGATKDGTTKDGAAKDGTTKDGATKDGATKDGATKDGATTPPASTDAPTVPPGAIDPSDAPDAFADDFEDGDDDTLSFDPDAKSPSKDEGAYGTAEPRQPPPPVPTAEVDPIPVAAYGIIGLVIGLAAPVAIGSLGGLALVSVANDGNATCDSCGIIILGFLGLGLGVVGSGPLGIIGATGGTVFGQLSKGSSMLPSLGGGAAGVAVMALGIVGGAIGIPLAAGFGDLGGGPARDAAIAASLGIPALLFVLSGPVAVAVTALIELTFASNEPPAPTPAAARPPTLAAPRQASVRY